MLTNSTPTTLTASAGAQCGNTQVAEIPRKSGGRARSAARLMPQVRESLPQLFDQMPAERVVEDIQISKLELIEEVLRDTRRRMGFTPRPRLLVSRTRSAA